MEALATETTVVEMPLYKLIVDTKYQRPSDMKRAKKIADNFIPALAGVIEIAPMGGDRFAVIDGQHRLLAMREKGIQKWWVKINHLTVEEQADTFVKLQKSRKTISPFEQHKALLIAGDPKARALETLVNERGLIFQPNNANKAKGIRAIAAFYRMYEVGGITHSRRVTSLILNIWPEDDANVIFQAPILRGFDMLLRQYPEALDARIVEKIRTISPFKLLRDAVSTSVTGSTSGTATGVREIIIKNYNKGLSTSRLGYKPESK